MNGNRIPNNSPLNWRAYPLVPLAVCLGGGIGWANWWSYALPPTAAWLLLLSTIVFGAVAVQQFSRQLYRNLLGGVLLLLFVFLGYWRAADHHLPNATNYFGAQLNEEESTDLIVEIAAIRPGENSLRLLVDVQSVVIAQEEAAPTASGKLLVYLPPTEGTDELAVGDQLLIAAQPQRIRGPLNPYAFDAQTYWGHQSVFYQAFIRDEESWTRLGTSRRSLVATAEYVREQWLKSFSAYLSGDQLAVAAALVLGKRDLLTDEISSAYADTGAVHVLAVSGLHVGIVAGIFLFLLRRILPRHKRTRLVRTLLVIVVIWAFAFVTGLSPSVQRSATMFSILLLGTLWRRKTYLLNTLAGAAMVMLLWNPQQLFQVGFQLSFAAVTGIGLFLRPIQKAVFFPAAWQRGIWSVLSVSLAAQLGTLPFSIYYFHQLPLYFLLSGSLVILTAHAALIFGLLHGFMALVMPFLQPFSAALLGGAVWLQNAIVYWSRQWPGAKQELDWIFPWEVAVLISVCLCLAAWIRWRSFSVAGVGLLLLLVFLGVRLQSSHWLDEQQRLVIYQQPKATLLDVISGRQSVRLSTPDISPRSLSFTANNHQSARRYTITEHWPSSNPKNTQQSLDGIVYRYGNWLDLPSGPLLIFDGDDKALNLGGYTPKTLLLTNDAGYVEVSQIIDLQAVENILLDGSNRHYTRTEWLEKSQELPAKLIDLSTHGAYVEDWVK